MITINASYARMPPRAATAKLTRTDWAVLHAIGLHVDEDGRAFPSMDRIAAIVGAKRKNIPRTIKRLEERGLLRRRRVPRPQGGWHNHYELTFEPIRVLSPEDTITEHVLTAEDAEAKPCPQDATNRVLTGEALTTQGTVSYQERESLGVEEVNGGHVLTTEDTGLEPATKCTRYIPLATGFKICGLPAVTGSDRCVTHAAATVRLDGSRTRARAK